MKSVAYPTDAGLLAKAVGKIAATGRRIRAASGATRTKLGDRSRTGEAGARGLRRRCEQDSLRTCEGKCLES